MRLSPQGNDRDAHDERLAGSKPAGKRRCIKGDVDVVILFQIIGTVRTQIDPCGVEADAGETRFDFRFAVRHGSDFPLDEKPRARHRFEDGPPKHQGFTARLCKIIEAAERHIAVSQSGRLRRKRRQRAQHGRVVA